MVNQPIGNHGLGIFGVVKFDLGPLLQGQMSIAQLKSAYNLLPHYWSYRFGMVNQPIGNHGLGMF